MWRKKDQSEEECLQEKYSIFSQVSQTNMPFHLRGHPVVNAPVELFSSIDRDMCTKVLPSLQWSPEGEWRRSVIAPNLKQQQKQSPYHYLVKLSERKGIFLCEVGTWLDYCLIQHSVKHTDGVKRIWRTESESLLRLKQTRHIYFFNDIPAYYLRYRENNI